VSVSGFEPASFRGPESNSNRKKQRPLVLAVCGLRRLVCDCGRADRWLGRGHTSGRGAESQMLKRFRIKLPARIQPVRFLKFLHGIDCGIVPFTIGLPAVRAVLCQGLLNFRNTVGSRGFLPPLPPFGFPRSFLNVVCCGSRLAGRGICRCCALGLRRSYGHTRRDCHKQRESQAGRFLQSHKVSSWKPVNLLLVVGRHFP
jgi:hypothetical protein